MADALPTSAQKKVTATKPPGARPDFATIGGIAVALAGILGGLLLEKGSLQDVAQVTAAMIVLGGTLGAVLVTTPLPVFIRACKGLGGAFLEKGSSTAATIDSLIRYASLARRNGSRGDFRSVPAQSVEPGGGRHRPPGTAQDVGAGHQLERVGR